MQQLQAVLDRSLDRASKFTRSLFVDDQWDAERVAAFVNSTRNMTAATVSSTGAPHAAVVIAACLDGDIHFTAALMAALSRNLANSDQVAFTLTDGTHAVMGRGTAVVATTPGDDSHLVDRLAAMTKGGVFVPPGWDGHIYRIEIERIFAN